MRRNNKKVAFFLPVRAGSQRVLNKNTKPFAGHRGGLLENKLNQLTELSRCDEIILSSNDDRCLEIGMSMRDKVPNLRVLRRPDCLCDSATNLRDLIRYVGTVTDCQHILWGHVTTPLVDASIYDDAIGCYFESLKHGYDSLVGVSPFRNFLLNGEGKMVNNSTGMEWPRTQDLTPLYEINHAVFLASRKFYLEGNRLGAHPKLYELDKIKSYDVDWPEDFVIAEILYKHFKNN